MPGLKLSAVVPCYNEREGMQELHRRLDLVCQACVGDSYERVLANDGSKDATWQTMRELSVSDKHVVAINLSPNYGHQLAVSAGLQMCRGERVFILDADLQDPSEILPQMMARMDDGCDVVFGQRVKREGEIAFKKASSYVFYRLLNRMVDIEITADTGDFRLMNRKSVDILNSMPGHHRFSRPLFIIQEIVSSPDLTAVDSERESVVER